MSLDNMFNLPTYKICEFSAGISIYESSVWVKIILLLLGKDFYRAIGILLGNSTVLRGNLKLQTIIEKEW